MLDVVKLGEFAAVVGRDELLKFFQRLIAEVATVDQKQNAPCAGKFNKAINEIGSGVCLAAAGGHLDKRTTFVCSERFLEITDRFDLRGPKIGRGHLIRSQKVG